MGNISLRRCKWRPLVSEYGAYNNTVAYMNTIQNKNNGLQLKCAFKTVLLSSDATFNLNQHRSQKGKRGRYNEFSCGDGPQHLASTIQFFIQFDIRKEFSCYHPSMVLVFPSKISLHLNAEFEKHVCFRLI